MEALDGDGLLRTSRAAAYKFTPSSYRHWIDDIACEAALIALQSTVRRGHYPTLAFFRCIVLKAVRRFFGVAGTGRNAEAWSVDVDEAHYLGESFRADDRALTLARLQKVWPTLTENQQESLMLYLSGCTDSEVALKMGVSPDMARKRRRRAVTRIDHNIQDTHRHLRFEPEQVFEIQEMRSRGLTIQAIADRFGVNYGSIHTVLRKKDAYNRERRGEHCARCGAAGHRRTRCPKAPDYQPDLTAAQVQEARSMLDEGKTVSDLSRHFGLHRTRIERALGGVQGSMTCGICRGLGHNSRRCPRGLDGLLTRQQLEEAERLHEAGASLNQLAKHLGVSRHSIKSRFDRRKVGA